VRDVRSPRASFAATACRKFSNAFALTSAIFETDARRVIAAPRVFGAPYAVARRGAAAAATRSADDRVDAAGATLIVR